MDVKCQCCGKTYDCDLHKHQGFCAICTQLFEQRRMHRENLAKQEEMDKAWYEHRGWQNKHLPTNNE